VSRAVTVADLLAELAHIGADPATTTFRLDGEPVVHGDHRIDRVEGVAVVRLDGVLDDAD
jgi:hypothetical protein